MSGTVKASTFVHNGLKVSYELNDIGNTTIWVYLAKDVCVTAVCYSSGEIYSVVLTHGKHNGLWFGEFTMESNVPGNAQVQIAPWLPLLQPIFAAVNQLLATEPQ